MSTTETNHEETSDRPILARTFEAVELAADGRNVELLCAPFDTAATVVDPPPVGNGQPFLEEFARGAFAGATKAPNRVLLEFEHFHPGLSGVIGHGSELEERDDALYGRFRVTEHSDGDKALQLIKDGVLTAASVFFAPLRSARSDTGVMRRLKVHLDRVALCRVGSYPQAQVLAVRSQTVIEELEDELPFKPELADFLAARGIAIPERLNLGRATWSTAYVDNLADSAFLYIEPGGTKDGEGKTEPRSLRHFPYKDSTGKVDLPHLRNALARIAQSSFSSDLKDRLTSKAQGILQKATG